MQGMAARVGKTAFLRQQRAVMNRPDSHDHLAGIAVPTLIAVGAYDRIKPAYRRTLWAYGGTGRTRSYQLAPQCLARRQAFVAARRDRRPACPDRRRNGERAKSRRCRTHGDSRSTVSATCSVTRRDDSSLRTACLKRFVLSECLPDHEIAISRLQNDVSVGCPLISGRGAHF